MRFNRSANRSCRGGSGARPCLVFLLILLLLALAGCRSGSPLPGAATPGGAFVPPPLAATQPPPAPTPTFTPALLAPQASPTPACISGLRYLEDLSLPDGTLVEPGQPLDKRWRVENSGACNWDESYRLVLVSGADLGVTSPLALYPARAGAQAELQIVFTAPQQPGRYRSEWQAHDPDGQPFGDPIYIEIEVEASPSSSNE